MIRGEIMKRDSLGDRMKRYEYVTRTYLTNRVPVIIRLDGKSFHTFTRGFNKPYDTLLMQTMMNTMQKLCTGIQGCVFGYTQSDEITLVLVDYQTIDTDAWFGYNIQKIASVSASMATMEFNRIFSDNVAKFNYNMRQDVGGRYIKEDYNLWEIYNRALKNGAMFDSRVFNVPKDEVCNCLIWRQQDATRNSIEAAGQRYFSHKQLMNKSCNDIQEMLFQKYNINWNDYPTSFKRGSACYRVQGEEKVANKATNENETVTRSRWLVDENIPIFTQDRNFVERWIDFE